MRNELAETVQSTSDSRSSQGDARDCRPRRGRAPALGGCRRTHAGRFPPLRGILGAVTLFLVARAWSEPDISVEAVAPGEDSVPCRIHRTVGIDFPPRALSDGVVNGEARLLLDVNSAGELVDLLVIGYTRRDFADAALNAVPQWRFTPARVGGEPASSTITLNVQFNTGGVHAYVKASIGPEETPSAVQQFMYRPANAAHLDEPLSAITRPRPMYLREWIEEGRTGSVTVEFYIDEKGRVRFPSVLGQADEYLGAAAIDAVKRWRFRPPVHHGRPVLTRVQQVFYFYPQERDPPDP